MILPRELIRQDLISDAEGHRLALLARRVPKDQVIVEIGSGAGIGTAWLDFGAQGSRRILSCDPWTGNPEASNIFRQNMISVQCHPEQYTMTAVELAQRVGWTRPGAPRVGLLFHDAAHEDDAIITDIKAFMSYMAIGVRVAVHDFVARVWNTHSNTWEEVVPRETHQSTVEKIGQWSDEHVIETLWDGAIKENT